jgi:hypothetical protein
MSTVASDTTTTTSTATAATITATCDAGTGLVPQHLVEPNQRRKAVAIILSEITPLIPPLQSIVLDFAIFKSISEWSEVLSEEIHRSYGDVVPNYFCT